jgi:hypothetical protein
MLPAMRLFCVARAARLPWGVCVARFRLVSASIVLLLLPCIRPALQAQTAPPKSTQDVLNAPPPTPELTELDERKPPEAPPTPAPAKPPVEPPPIKKPVQSSPVSAPAKPPGEPAPGKAASGAAPGKQEAVPVPVRKRVAADGGGSPPSSAAVGGAEGEAGSGSGSGSEAGTEEVPPPPSLDGDFAGSGAAPDAAVSSGPQDDFAADAQEYTRPKKREYSVRVDLLNWLLLGRLSIELEAAVWKFLSVTLTPVFVLAKSPIAINYAGVDDPVTQHSNGIGPLSGVSVGVGAWLWGEPFKGYVLRLEFTNYGYSYRSDDSQGRIDRVDFTERRVLLFIGSHSRFGAFTFAGGFGLGYELNQETRCGLSSSSSDTIQARTSDCRGRQQIALDRGVQERMDLNGPLHPVYFLARFSLGVVF